MCLPVWVSRVRIPQSTRDGVLASSWDVPRGCSSCLPLPPDACMAGGCQSHRCPVGTWSHPAPAGRARSLAGRQEGWGGEGGHRPGQGETGRERLRLVRSCSGILLGARRQRVPSLGPGGQAEGCAHVSWASLWGLEDLGTPGGSGAPQSRGEGDSPLSQPPTRQAQCWSPSVVRGPAKSSKSRLLHVALPVVRMNQARSLRVLNTHGLCPQDAGYQPPPPCGSRTVQMSPAVPRWARSPPLQRRGNGGPERHW